MTNTISFNIVKQNLVRTDNEKVVDLSQGYLNAEFKLEGTDWLDDDKYNKYALFRYGELSFAVDLVKKEGEAQLYVCEVPFEILRYDNFIMTVYAAGKPSTEYAQIRITTNSLKIKVDNSNFTNDLNTPREPSKDAFSLVFEELRKKINTNEAETKINNKVTEAISAIHFPDVTVISDSTASGPGSLSGQKGDIWINIVTTIDSSTPPVVSTTILKYIHDGTNWNKITL